MCECVCLCICIFSKVKSNKIHKVITKIPNNHNQCILVNHSFIIIEVVLFARFVPKSHTNLVYENKSKLPDSPIHSLCMDMCANTRYMYIQLYMLVLP